MKEATLLVTGPTRGLGLIIARRWLAGGGRVYGIARQPSAEWAALEREHPERAHLLLYDLADWQGVEQAVFADFLPGNLVLDGLVNNAALAYGDLVSHFRGEALEEMFRVNVYAAFALCRGFVRNQLLHSGAGAVVHLSSVTTRVGARGLSFYAATKGALEAFSLNFAREWGPRGIRSNCVAAGFLDTEMTADLGEEERQRIFRRPSLPGPVSLESVAGTVLHLLGPDSASVTGTCVRVDGGA